MFLNCVDGRTCTFYLKGEVEEEYSTDGVGSSQLLDTIANKTALEVAPSTPRKPIQDAWN